MIKHKIIDTVKSKLVLDALELDNYLIEIDENIQSDICCIYFSSHALYYPETEENFKREILEKNVFEWYRKRVLKAKKHIFIRDIRKQFYVEGINKHIDSMDSLIEWLRRETNGWRVITIGSSAGGYAAISVGGGAGS